jgi:outer membrane biogenesis lipoprotein LolB
MNRLIWLLVPALLVMASCRSAKKGTGNGTVKTTPVETVNTPATPSKGTQNAPTKQETAPVTKQIAAGTNFTAKVKVRLKRDDKDISTTGTLRMRYDDVIQITLVDPLLGIAEVGRLELSPDNVLVIDRLNKRYVSTTYEEFSSLKSRNIGFSTIQDFFWQEAQTSDKVSYTIPASRPIQLDLQLSGKGNASNWEAHTTVSDKYVKTDANKLFSNLMAQ